MIPPVPGNWCHCVSPTGPEFSSRMICLKRISRTTQIAQATAKSSRGASTTHSIPFMRFRPQLRLGVSALGTELAAVRNGLAAIAGKICVRRGRYAACRGRSPRFGRRLAAFLTASIMAWPIATPAPSPAPTPAAPPPSLPAAIGIDCAT